MSGNQRNRWEPILGTLTIRRATSEWQLSGLVESSQDQFAKFCVCVPCWSVGFRFGACFWKHFLQGFSKTVDDTPGKTKMVLHGAWFDRWKSPWWASDLNLETQVVVKASQTVTPCLRQHGFLRVRSLSKAIENRDLGNLYFCSIQILQFVNLANLSDSYARWAPVKRGRFAHFLCSLLLLTLLLVPLHATRLQNVSF